MFRWDYKKSIALVYTKFSETLLSPSKQAFQLNLTEGDVKVKF